MSAEAMEKYCSFYDESAIMLNEIFHFKEDIMLELTILEPRINHQVVGEMNQSTVS